MNADNNYKIFSQNWRLVFLDLLVETKLCHSVHFVDKDFHLICTQMTKVQDAHDMRVLQLAGSR